VEVDAEQLIPTLQPFVVVAWKELGEGCRSRLSFGQEHHLEIVQMRFRLLATVFALISIAAIFSACASRVPEMIRESGASLTLAQVQQAPPSAVGQSVRWGGTILAVRNLPDRSEIELLARPLTDDGEPRADAKPLGRFIAEVSEFVDPAEYSQDRRLTVSGPVREVVVRDIGEYPYHYPVVSASSRYLWPVERWPLAGPNSVYASGAWGWGPPYWPYPGPYYGPYYRPWFPYW
jgi:outer membrane lipoprotein